jgi:leucyl-tRNA synthetase
MEYVNELYKTTPAKEDIVVLAKLLKPFAPHLASEMLEQMKSDDEWPVWDEKYLTADTVEVVVQVNGKLRAKLLVDIADLEDEAKLSQLAVDDEHVKKYLNGKPKKVIVVKKAKLVNVVA